MRKQKLLTKALAASMAVFMSVSQLSVPAFAAEGTKSVSTQAALTHILQKL